MAHGVFTIPKIENVNAEAESVLTARFPEELVIHQSPSISTVVSVGVVISQNNAVVSSYVVPVLWRKILNFWLVEAVLHTTTRVILV